MYWLMLLGLGIVLELVIAVIVGNPAGDLQTLSQYTYNVPTQNIQIDQNGIQVTTNTPASQTTNNVKFITVLVLVAGSLLILSIALK